MKYIMSYILFESSGKFLYFAHPINTYGTDIEKKCIDSIKSNFPDYTIINPSDEKYQNEFSDYRNSNKEDYMPYFKSLVDRCSVVVYLPFQDCKIGSGVYYEIKSLEDHTKVYQIDAVDFDIKQVSPEYVESNKIDVSETRNRIKSKYFVKSILLNDNPDPDMILIGKIRKLIPIGSSILEISCGNAADAIKLKELGYNVTCTDSDPNYVRHAKQNGLTSMQHDTLDEFDTKNKFDLVYCRLGLHYFTENQLDNIFNNLNKICKYIIFSVKVIDDDKGTGKEIFDKDKWVSIVSKYFNLLDVEEKEGYLYGSKSKWIEISASK